MKKRSAGLSDEEQSRKTESAPALGGDVPAEVYQTAAASATDWPGEPQRPSWLNPLGIPRPLTTKQYFYLWGPQCLGAAVVSGMANFGIACAMYRTTSKSVLFWPLAHNTIAGDLAVTIFIQGIITFIAVSALVHNDLRLRRIDPFPCPWPSTEYGAAMLDETQATTRVGKLFRRFHNQQGFGRGLHFFSGSDAQDLLDFKNVKGKDMLGRWVLGIWKGSVLSALFWFIWWPISVAILAPIWGGKNMQGTWIPPLIKLIYAFTYALIQNPIVACIALGSEDACREHVREEQYKRWQELSGLESTPNEKVPPTPTPVRSPTPSVNPTPRASIDLPPPRASLDFDHLRNDPTPRRSASIDRHTSRDVKRLSLEVPSPTYTPRGRPQITRSTSDHGHAPSRKSHQQVDRVKSLQSSGASTPRRYSADISRSPSVDVAALRRSLDMVRRGVVDAEESIVETDREQ